MNSSPFSKEDYALIPTAAALLESAAGGLHLPASPSDRLPRLPMAVLPISPYNHNPAEKQLSISCVLFPQDDGVSCSCRLSGLMAASAVCVTTHFVILQLRVTPGSSHTSNSDEIKFSIGLSWICRLLVIYLPYSLDYNKLFMAVNDASRFGI